MASSSVPPATVTSAWAETPGRAHSASAVGVIDLKHAVHRRRGGQRTAGRRNDAHRLAVAKTTEIRLESHRAKANAIRLHDREERPLGDDDRARRRLDAGDDTSSEGLHLERSVVVSLDRTQKDVASRLEGAQLCAGDALLGFERGILLHDIGEFGLRRVERRTCLGQLGSAAATRSAELFELANAIPPDLDLLGQARFMHAMGFAKGIHRLDLGPRRLDFLQELPPRGAVEAKERRASIDILVLGDEKFDAPFERCAVFALRCRQKFESARHSQGVCHRSALDLREGDAEVGADGGRDVDAIGRCRRGLRTARRSAFVMVMPVALSVSRLGGAPTTDEKGQ
jgi:hypothetical protein